MKVFIWKSFGDIEVYSMETQELRDNLRKIVIECLLSDGDYEVTEASSWSDVYDSIQDAICSRSDMFEQGTGVANLKEA